MPLHPLLPSTDHDSMQPRSVNQHFARTMSITATVFLSPLLIVSILGEPRWFVFWLPWVGVPAIIVGAIVATTTLPKRQPSEWLTDNPENESSPRSGARLSPEPVNHRLVNASKGGVIAGGVVFAFFVAHAGLALVVGEGSWVPLVLGIGLFLSLFAAFLGSIIGALLPTR